MVSLFDPNTASGRMLRDLWRDIQRKQDERSIAAAKADPKAHKLSTLIADHKPASSTYYGSSHDRGKSRRVYWAHTDHPNIAGYYLSFRHVQTKRTVKRTQFKAHKHKYLAEKRCQDELRKAAERRMKKAPAGTGAE